MAMAQATERKPYLTGLDVRRTANGFVVYPPRDFYRSGSEFLDHADMHVFRTAAELAAWLLQQYPEAA